MCAGDPGRVRQRREPCQRDRHLLGGALEDPPAAGGEQGVATQDQPAAVVGHVAGGVAGNVDHLERHVGSGHEDTVAVANRVVDAVDVLAAGTPDRGRPGGEEVSEPADVVAVVVGDQDSRELELVSGKVVEDRTRVSGIDHQHLSSFRRPHEPDVVVGKDGYRLQVKHTAC